MNTIRFEGDETAAKEWQQLFIGNLATPSTSLIFTKQLTAMAISCITYARRIFPADAYSTKVLGGREIKILSALESIHEASYMTRCLKNAFEALEKKYMKHLIFELINSDGSLIEFYSIGYAYKKNEAFIHSMKLSTDKKDQSESLISSHNKTIHEATASVIHKLVEMMKDLPPLPPNYSAKLRVTYYEERTPINYKPRLFSDINISFADEHKHLKGVFMGSVKTLFHDLTIAGGFCEYPARATQDECNGQVENQSQDKTKLLAIQDECNGQVATTKTKVQSRGKKANVKAIKDEYKGQEVRTQTQNKTKVQKTVKNGNKVKARVDVEKENIVQGNKILQIKRKLVNLNEPKVQELRNVEVKAPTAMPHLMKGRIQPRTFMRVGSEVFPVTPQYQLPNMSVPRKVFITCPPSQSSSGSQVLPKGSETQVQSPPSLQITPPRQRYVTITSSSGSQVLPKGSETQVQSPPSLQITPQRQRYVTITSLSSGTPVKVKVIGTVRPVKVKLVEKLPTRLTLPTSVPRKQLSITYPPIQSSSVNVTPTPKVPTVSKMQTPSTSTVSGVLPPSSQITSISLPGVVSITPPASGTPIALKVVNVPYVKCCCRLQFQETYLFKCQHCSTWQHFACYRLKHVMSNPTVACCLDCAKSNPALGCTDPFLTTLNETEARIEAMERLVMSLCRGVKKINASVLQSHLRLPIRTANALTRKLVLDGYLSLTNSPSSGVLLITKKLQDKIENFT